VPEEIIDWGGGNRGGGDQRGVQTRMETTRQSAITTTNRALRVIAEDATSQYALIDPGDGFNDITSLPALTGGGMSGGLGGPGTGKGFGDGNGGSIGGNNHGIGRIFGPVLPRTELSKRCSKQDRIQRLKDNGGTPACEDAVVKGLNWLRTHQAADGSWGSQKAAMTGLALLAYFGHCETPQSMEFGDTTFKGITYLVDLGMKNNGRLATNGDISGQPFCYEHAIATYALAEAATFCKEFKVAVPNLMEITEQAGQFIIDNQNANGGWAYNYARSAGHTDVSVTGWQIQALKACSHTGIKFRRLMPSVNNGLKYLATCQNDIGAFGYTGPPAAGSYYPLTGVGVLCNQMWGKRGAEVSKGVRAIAKFTEFEYAGASGNLYQHYYESQAMMQRGGSEWRRYNDLFRDQILNNQNDDGSWKIPGGKAIASGGEPVYNTSLCILMLEVYYRFLSTGGNIKERSNQL
jgi:hypothetical protein